MRNNECEAKKVESRNGNQENEKTPFLTNIFCK
ncbi:hypothetical protein BSG1_15460 [Bacillus sp. SG-1]|nr:hypothetical protein BSG1_15460 [Bacillus sp. SG-1]